MGFEALFRQLFETSLHRSIACGALAAALLAPVASSPSAAWAEDESPEIDASETSEPPVPDPSIEVMRIEGERTSSPGLEPVAVETEVISREEIDTLPAVDAAGLVRNLPGIRVQNRIQGEVAAVSIEGLPPTYTAILVDGQRYAGEIGGVNDLRDFPLANVDRVEILRGPQGLRYGPEAAGGVVNLISKPVPLYEPTLNVEFGGGADKAEQAKGALGGGADGRGAVLAIDYDKLGGYDAPSDREGYVFVPPDEDSLRESIDLYGRSSWIPFGALTLDARFGWRKRDEDFGSDENNLLRKNERWFGGVGTDWQLSPDTFATLAVNYYRSSTESTVGREFELVDDEIKLELRGEHDVDLGITTNTLTVGADLRRHTLELDESELEAEIAAQVGTRKVDENDELGGFYFIGETWLGERFQAEYGVRAQLHSRYSAKLIPQVALLATPLQWGGQEELRLRFSWGRNYRYPSLRDLFQPETPQNGGGYFLAGNEDLRRETTDAFRVGIEVDPYPGVTLSVVGFHNDIDEHIRSAYQGETLLIDVVPIPPNDFLCNLGQLEWCDEQLSGTPSNVLRKDNLDKVRTRGIEARVGLSLHENIDFDLSYTRMQTKVRDSNVLFEELPNEPDHVVNTRLTLTAPITETVFTARTQWRSSALKEGSGTGLVSFSTGERSDPSVNLDLRIMQPILDRFAFFADVYNVTNNRFVDSYIVRGRTFFVGARGEFF